MGNIENLDTLEDRARTDPPDELPPRIESSAERIHKHTLKTETQKAIVQIRQILTTGLGVLNSADSFGRATTYNAGDLWGVLTENEEWGDLHIFAGLGLAPDNQLLRQQCDQFLGTRLAPFITAHAELMADRAVSDYLSEEGC